MGYDPQGHAITRNIEDIHVGDVVLSRPQDDPAAAVQPRQVTAVDVHTVTSLRLLDIQEADGTTETIRTTDEHPFWVTDVGWVKAGDLQVGQQLVTSAGQVATLTATRAEPHPEGITVYNFTVDQDHTYFVTDVADDEAVWVHNTDDDPLDPPADPGTPVDRHGAPSKVEPIVPEEDAADAFPTPPGLAGPAADFYKQKRRELEAQGAPADAAAELALEQMLPYDGRNRDGEDAAREYAAWKEAVAASEDGGGFVDWAQGGLDVVGTFDPTPIADGINMVISLTRGNWTDAGLSAVSMVPYLGDAFGKSGKAVRYANKIRKAEVAAAKLATKTVRHHAWPKYLGGPAKQTLEKLSPELHKAYHRGLDQLLPRWRSAKYFEGLSPAEQAANFERFRKYTRAFDAKNGTRLWEAIEKVASAL